jgi:hypothetical protein
MPHLRHFCAYIILMCPPGQIPPAHMSHMLAAWYRSSRVTRRMDGVHLVQTLEPQSPLALLCTINSKRCATVTVEVLT